MVLGDVQRLNLSDAYQAYSSLKETANSFRVGSEPRNDLPKSLLRKRAKTVELSREGLLLLSETIDSNANKRIEALVEMKNLKIKYGEKQILGGWDQGKSDVAKDGLWWTVRRGERWGVFGPNGKQF